MSLLPVTDYADMFAELMGRRIGFVPLPGSRGDSLIEAGAAQLLRSFGVDHCRIDRRDLTPDLAQRGIDQLVVSGGGNMGKTYVDTWKVRQLALSTRLPVTVLPQSFTDTAEDLDPYQRVYARERVSLALDKRLRLGPDLALAFAPSGALPEPVFGAALFLRKDWESVQPERSRSLCDPVKLCRTLEEFLCLAALFRVVITDRLHFAIAALIARRHVFLLPNAYHKNRAMYDTWLDSLGCRWLSSISESGPCENLQTDIEPVRELLRATGPRDVDAAYRMPTLGIA